MVQGLGAIPKVISVGRRNRGLCSEKPRGNGGILGGMHFGSTVVYLFLSVRRRSSVLADRNQFRDPCDGFRREQFFDISPKTGGFVAPIPPELTLSASLNKGARRMSTITTSDGTEIYYKDWGAGPVVTFSHGWPLSADTWDGQMQFLAENGYRAVAHDRRGHGRSSQPSNGNEMDTYA